MAALDGAEERVQRDYGLAGADVALQKALHRHRALEVRVDLHDRALLVLRQRERQRLAVARDQLTRLRERRRHRLLASLRRACEAELQDEQLVEGEAPARALGLVERAWTVECLQRIASRRQSLLLPERGRQRIAEVARERGQDELPELLRRHVLAGGIDRHELGVTRRRFVRADGERAASKRADQPHARSLAKLLRDPRLVEPCHADLARAVGDGRLYERQAPPRHALRHATDGSLDRDLLDLPEETRDRTCADIAERRVLDEVANATETELGKPCADRLADARQRVELPVEIGRTAARRRPGRRRVHA